MANTCRTDIRIEASEEAINYFREKYNNCNDGGDYYWDEVIDPLFDNLRNELNK